MSTSRRVTIPASELSFQFSRSGGPGGQNVNKVETKVTVLFDHLRSSALSIDEKSRLAAHPRVLAAMDADGYIAVTCQEHRTQALNREGAVSKLHELLHAALRRQRKRIPTRKTYSSERKRLEGKRVRKSTKSGRKKFGFDRD
jgi:ribosome-associated protein